MQVHTISTVFAPHGSDAITKYRDGMGELVREARGLVLLTEHPVLAQAIRLPGSRDMLDAMLKRAACLGDEAHAARQKAIADGELIDLLPFVPSIIGQAGEVCITRAAYAATFVAWPNFPPKMIAHGLMQGVMVADPYILDPTLKYFETEADGSTGRVAIHAQLDVIKVDGKPANFVTFDLAPSQACPGCGKFPCGDDGAKVKA